MRRTIINELQKWNISGTERRPLLKERRNLMKRVFSAGILMLFLVLAIPLGALADRVPEIIEQLHLSGHPEGGWFSEVYTSPRILATADGDRALAGSIYYLLGKQGKSSFHQIDCDEIWYYHEGIGMRIYILKDNGRIEERLLGKNFSKGELPMVIVPAQSVFAAENIAPEGYTLISCMTTPKFRYQGWRLVPKAELFVRYPEAKALIYRLAD